MRREHIEEIISKEVEKLIAGTGLELVDVEYVREKNWYLRVFIDKQGGIGLEDCQVLSEQLSKYLDEADPIQDNYLLEVSSPGLDRILKKDKDFLRYQGRDVDIHFFKPYEGVKDLVANLSEKDGDVLKVHIDGKEKTIEMKDIAQVRLHIDF
jgi:ribosome maturation factor RimP